MASRRKLRVGFVWAQFAPYHVDRCEAVGRHLHDKADVLFVEVASASHTYSWPVSGALTQAEKMTLFPGQAYEDVPVLKRFIGLLRAFWAKDIVFFGIGYNELFVIAIAALLRVRGCKVIMMTDSKFEDKPRSAPFEFLKSLMMLVFHGAIVAGPSQRDYVSFLSFRRRPVLTGYDTVSMERIRGQATAEKPTPYEERPFICVARLVPKKNLFALLEAYARYTSEAKAPVRRLILVGDGPLKLPIQECIEKLGLADLIDMIGFQDSSTVTELMARSLTLVLVSTEEQWGLVVNEAVALGLPIIASDRVGARDSLVTNLVNGYVVPAHHVGAIAQAMLQMGRDEGEWERMRRNSCAISVEGDVGILVKSVDQIISMAIRH